MSSNPDQAIALFYDGGQAPVLTANQFGDDARQLIEQAYELGIPIYENPELLMQLQDLALGDEVPVELYQLIAEILAFAFYIQGKAPKGYEV